MDTAAIVLIGTLVGLYFISSVCGYLRTKRINKEDK